MMNTLQKQLYARRKELLEEEGYLDTDSEDEREATIQSILLELIPTYYKYHDHLTTILNENAMGGRINGQTQVSQWKDKLDKIENFRKDRTAQLNESKIKVRIRIAERLILKQKKRKVEERELMEKYEAKEIRRLIGQQSSVQASDEVSELDQSSPQFKHGHRSRRASIQNKIRYGQASSIFQSDEAHTSGNYPKGWDFINIKESRNLLNVQQPENRPIIDSFALRESGDRRVGRYEGKQNNLGRENNKRAQLGPQRTLHEQEGQHRRSSSQTKEAYFGENQGSIVIENIRANKKPALEDMNLEGLNFENSHSDNIGDSAIRYEIDSQDGPDDFFGNQSRVNVKLSSNNLVALDNMDIHSQRNGQRRLNRQNTPNFDLYSQKNGRGDKNPYFDLQRKKLEKQRQLAEQLHRQVSEVLGESDNQEVKRKYTEVEDRRKYNKEGGKYSDALAHPLAGQDDQYQITVNRQVQPRSLSALKCILEELCELWAITEYFKCLLKNKQYSMIRCLCGDQIGTGPILLKLISQGAMKFLKVGDKNDASNIVGRMLGQVEQITFEDFGGWLKSKLNEMEAQYINIKVAPINPYEMEESLHRLLSVISEIIYFEQQAKKLAHNSQQVKELKTLICSEDQEDMIDVSRMEQFIYGTTGNRGNRVRVSMFLDNTLASRRVQDLLLWLNDSPTFNIFS